MDEYRDVQPEAATECVEPSDATETWPVPGLRLELTQTLDFQAA